jgi:hypothetical protein
VAKRAPTRSPSGKWLTIFATNPLAAVAKATWQWSGPHNRIDDHRDWQAGDPEVAGLLALMLLTDAAVWRERMPEAS